MSQSGFARLKCHALLEHPRSNSDTSVSVFFDAVIRCSQTVHVIPFVYANLHYIKGNSDEVIAPGIYEIEAKIIEYLPGRHLPSPTRPSEEFALMGDIVELHAVPSETGVDACSVARLTVSGRVLRVQNDIDTFLMKIQQVLTHPPPRLSFLKVRAVMGLNRVANQPLPTVNTAVTFSGEMVTFQGHIAIVTVDDIAYVTGPLNFREAVRNHTYSTFAFDMEGLD